PPPRHAPVGPRKPRRSRWSAAPTITPWWLPRGRRGRRVLHLDPQAAVGGHRVGPRAGEKDRVVRELDAVDDPGRVEDVDVVARLRVVDQLADLEAAGDHLLAVVRPNRRGVVEGILFGGELQPELEACRAPLQQLFEPPA